MTAGGDALDLALGIMRAPVRREAARARPLPEGITELLEIASGATATLQAASVRTGATAAELQEAARFFVQQVLLTEQADAYRVLGVSPGASKARIRDHHRLLLRWLHPDRDASAQWDSTLSFRVNWAWRHLRNDAAQRAYDGSGSGPGELDARDAGGQWRRPLATIPIPEVQQLTRRPRAGVAVPAPVMVVMLACLVLGVLALYRESQSDATRWHEQAPFAADTDARDDTPPTPAAAVAVSPGCTPAAAGAPCRDAADIPAPARRASSPIGVDDALPALPNTDAPLQSAALTLQPPDPEVAGSGALATLAPAAFTVEPDTRAMQSDAVEPARPVRPTVTPTDARPPDATPHAPAVRTLAQAQPMHAAPVFALEEDPLHLLQEAERAVEQIAAYLASSDLPLPPVWSNLETQAEATALRGALHARLQGGGRRRMALHTPHWRIDSDRATFDGSYQIDGWRSSNEDGQLHVALTRREQRWLADALRLEPGS